ncbi:MAG TPA: PAS domain-containing protein, partial [Phormidium sp.]
LFNIAQDAIVVVDEMGIIQRVNPAAESLFQLKDNQLLKSHLNQLLPNLGIYPQDWIDRSEYNLIRTNNSAPITVEVSVSDHSHQNCQEYVVILRDISDRKFAETKIRDSYNLLDGVINGTSDVIFVKNFQGQYLLINSAFVEVIGKPIEEIKDRTDLAIFPPDIAREIMELDRSIMVSGIPKTLEEYVLVQGEMRTFLATKTPLRDVQGKVVGIVGITRDISDRKLDEEALRQSEARLREQAQQLQKTLQELQQTQAQLVQTEKMSSLGQLVAGVAHEINNPVNFIYGNLSHANDYIQDLLYLLEMYQKYYPTPASEIQDLAEEIEFDFLKEDLPKLLSSMKVGSERIQKIVLALRNFSRMDEADLKQVDIHEGIDSTLMILQNRFKERAGHCGITVIKEYGDLPLIECYAGQLNQVFINIISNAIDALESIDCHKQLVEPLKIHICTKRLGSDRILIKITDNGPGMSVTV